MEVVTHHSGSGFYQVDLNCLSKENTEARRLEILKKTALLDSPMEKVFDRLTSLASMVLDVPVSLVSLVDDHRQFFKSQTGLPEPWCNSRETPLSHSFCKEVVKLHEPLIIEDARLAPLVAMNMAIPELGVIAYLGIPLKLSSGVVLGSFCAIDTKPRKWRDVDIEILSTLAASAISEIDLRLTHQELNETLHAISHDLKNPIGAIALSMELLIKKIQKKEIALATLVPSFDKISKICERMNILVRGILDKAKSLSLNESTKLENCDLLSLLCEVRDIYSVYAETSQIKIEIQAEAGVNVFWDKEQMFQVFSNLLSNAIHHSHKESTIYFHGRVENERAYFYVKDEGKGINPDDLPHVFDKFWKVNQNQKEGHGLGLHIVREIILAHHGEISITSQINTGTTVSFSIPQEISTLKSGGINRT
jgi:signal transduction histidine kinase